ncbi:MAG: SGNH/GDSL hydrolase family protein [Clostridia bacterium]|nr:SGNH/GDSL hydrolase family protein [Clostridia bacterium]
MRRALSVPIVFLSILLLCSSVMITSCGKTPKSSDIGVASGFEMRDAAQDAPDTDDAPDTKEPAPASGTTGDETDTDAPEESDTDDTDTEEPHGETDGADDGIFSGCLFVGDSRTVGLSTYGGIPGADVFATVGMSVYHVLTEKVDATGLGEMTLDELLVKMSYDDIVVMLGVNELGYNLDNTKRKYAEFVDHLREAAPESKITLCANLHITAEKSNSDEIYNNEKINSLNESIKSLADGVNVFYVDVNPLFDDDTGAFSEEYAYDDYHPVGIYYKTWGEWLAGEMGLLIR